MQKIIVITGGSDGLGKQIAKTLAKENKVIILARNEERLKRVAEEIPCEYFQCDVTDAKRIEEVIHNIIQKHSKIDVLINNAGIWLAGDVEENGYEEISKCIDINTKGPIYMIKAVLPFMEKEATGLIINVCSQASFDEDSFSAVYNASKWAMRGFNRSIQKYATKKGVKITGFYPGFMKTELFKKAGNDYDMSNALELDKVVKAIEYILEQGEEVMIPEIGIRNINDY